MKLLILILLFLNPLLLISQTDSLNLNYKMDESTLDIFEFITGKWMMNEERVYLEEWKREPDGSYTGKAFFIVDGKEKNPEKLKLHFHDGNIFYTADVSHNPEPVNFKLTEFDNNAAVFENPLHDFPRKITYIFKDDLLTATIEGPGKNDELKKFEFKMKRIDD
jgi:hypothetical protein